MGGNMGCGGGKGVNIQWGTVPGGGGGGGMMNKGGKGGDKGMMNKGMMNKGGGGGGGLEPKQIQDAVRILKENQGVS